MSGEYGGSTYGGGGYGGSSSETATQQKFMRTLLAGLPLDTSEDSLLSVVIDAIEASDIELGG